LDGEKKILGKSRIRSKGNVYNTWECGQVLPFKTAFLGGMHVLNRVVNINICINACDSK